MKVCDVFCYPFQLRGISEINANFEAEWDGDIFEVEIEVNGLCAWRDSILIRISFTLSQSC